MVVGVELTVEPDAAPDPVLAGADVVLREDGDASEVKEPEATELTYVEPAASVVVMLVGTGDCEGSGLSLDSSDVVAEVGITPAPPSLVGEAGGAAEVGASELGASELGASELGASELGAGASLDGAAESVGVAESVGAAVSDGVGESVVGVGVSLVAGGAAVLGSADETGASVVVGSAVVGEGDGSCDVVGSATVVGAAVVVGDAPVPATFVCLFSIMPALSAASWSLAAVVTTRVANMAIIRKALHQVRTIVVGL